MHKVEGEALFWKWKESHRGTAVDILTSKPPYEFVDFVKGSKTIAVSFEQHNPDVIFVSERGAGPISWATEVFDELRGNAYERVSLSIGTYTDALSNLQDGYRPSTKKKIIRDEVTKLLYRRNGEPVERPVLIDEVQSGRTLTTAALILCEALTEIHGIKELRVVAAQDDRKHIVHRKRIEHYKDLVANQEPGIVVQTVPMPLFTTDRTGILNAIVAPSKAPKEVKHRLLWLVPNDEAKKAIQNLVFAVEFPDVLADVLDLVKNDRPFSIDTEDEAINERAERLYFWVLEIMTNPDSVHQKANGKRITCWLEDLHRAALNHDQKYE